MRFDKLLLFHCKFKVESVLQVLGGRDAGRLAAVLRYIVFFTDHGRIPGGPKAVTQAVLSGVQTHKTKGEESNTSTAVALVLMLLLKLKAHEYLVNHYPTVSEDVRDVYKDVETFEKHFPSDARQQRMIERGIPLEPEA